MSRQSAASAPGSRAPRADRTGKDRSPSVAGPAGAGPGDGAQARPATIVDVARAAGVSKATVSLVLNGRGGALRISDATQVAVLAAADRLGYTPNHAARSLRSRRTGAIMLVVSRLGNPYYGEIATAALAAARARGYQLDVAEAGPAADEVAALDNLRSGRVDGVVIATARPAGDGDQAHARRAAARRELSRCGLPIVVLLDGSPDPAVPAIRIDDAEALAPFFDAARAAWNPAQCERFGVPAGLLPAIHRATDVVGAVTPDAARRTGLAAGTPVICGAADGMAEYVSSGAIEVGEGCIVLGTTMCISVLVAEPVAHPLLYAGASLVPGLHRLSGGMASAAALTRWFRDNFAPGEARLEQQLGLSAYQLLGDGAAAVPPGSDGLVVLPYFSGERTPIFDAQARGLILGLTVSHTRHHLYRALLEGVAYGIRHHLDLMAEVGVVPRRLVVVGGGSRSELWTQIISDVTGQPLDCVEGPVGPALADAFLAGYGTGRFGDFRPLPERWVAIGRTVRPDPAASATYDAYYAVYRRLYDRTAEEMHALSRLGAGGPPAGLTDGRAPGDEALGDPTALAAPRCR